MLPGRAFSRGGQLKESYIAISNYVRGGFSYHSPKLRRSFSCKLSLRNTEPQKRTVETQQDAPALERPEEAWPEATDNDTALLSHYKQICELYLATLNLKTPC
jgi:hypothetical protein